MEKKLKALFDFQRFENNEHLKKLISDTESRCGTELSDDELSFVNAAGDIFNMPKEAGENNDIQKSLNKGQGGGIY